jgi:hypothetical protein
MAGERPWENDEQDLLGAFAEFRRLLRRALSHPVRPILYALLITGALVGMRARKVQVYSSRIILRVAEGDLDAATSPRPAKQLRRHVLEVAFSNPRLLGLIKKKGLYPRDLAKDPAFAIESMREDIEVEVWRNYFLEQRGALDAGRTARIAISYQSRNPEVAYEVVKELGNLISEQEETNRISMADEAVLLAQESVKEAAEDLLRRRGQIVAKEMASHHAPAQAAALLRIEVMNLQTQIVPIEFRLKALEQTRNELELRAAMERNKMGLTFEVVDGGRQARLGESKRQELTRLAILTFLLVLPLCGLLAGAYDQRVYGIDDVRRLGLHSLGHVHQFPGDNMGALDARLDREHNEGSKP